MERAELDRHVARLVREWEIVHNDELDKRHGGKCGRDAVSALNGNEWINLNVGPPSNMSGAYRVRLSDGQVFGIKAYGVTHFGKVMGHVSNLTGADLEANRHRRAPFALPHVAA